MQEINATKMFFCLTLDKPRKKCISILLYFFSWFKEFLLLLHSEKSYTKNEIEHL